MRRAIVWACVGWAAAGLGRAAPADDLLQPGRIDGFTTHGGQWVVRDGAVWVDGGPGPKLVAGKPRFADGEAGVEVFFADGAAGNAGLVLRVGEAGEGADAFLGYEVALDPQRGVLRLGGHRHNFRLLRDVRTDVPLRRWVPLAVRLKGPQIDVDVDGKHVLSYVDNQDPLPAGGVGLRPWARSAGFRNLWVATDGERRELPFRQAAPDARDDPALSLADLPPIALITRHPLSRPNTISCDIWQSRPRQPGCSIRIFDPAYPDRAARTVFRDDDGCIYDMNVSCDARTLLFSYRRKLEAYWHLWRIATDGSGLRQLTDGPHQDISPLRLPDGDILFVSTRRGGYTVCQPGPASNLHRMGPDGGDIRCVSMNTLADFSPQMLPDGRVLFTRWEYVDRDLTYRQSLWTQNPDGTGYQLFFGNTIRDVGTFWQARPLPGRRDKVVATFAPHHGWPHGAIGTIDTRYGLEGPRDKGFVWVSREPRHIGDTPNEWSFRDPFPLSGSTFLVSYGGGGAERFRICLLNADGRGRVVYEDPAMGCYNPLPLRPVPVPPVIAPALTPPDVAYGRFVLQDACYGLSGVDPARVKGLRIMEQVRKSEDLVARAYDQSPVMSYGTYYAKRCWGTVELAADKSAYFQVPAGREIYFQLLDADGRELHRMTSAAQVMPGQTLGCVGCHEPRHSAPPARAVPLALRGEPAMPRPPDWAPDGIIDFPTAVQPVLDKYCIRCHSGPDPAGGMTLTGDKTRLFSMAYDNLLGRSRSYRQHDMATGEMLPEEKRKPKPLVHFFWLLRTPTGVNQPLWTGSHASRLLEHTDTTHCERRVPLADRRRIYAWIDADVPYYGTYAHSRPGSPGRRDLCTDAATGKESAWFARDFLGVYNRRCAGCHGKFPHPNDHGSIWDGRLAWINFSNPALSPALTAHLAKPAGRGISLAPDPNSPPKFAGPDDADYRALLRAIEVGKQNMLAHPRADMPGFRGARKEP